MGDPIWDTPDVTWGREVASNIPTIMCLKDFEKWIRQNRIELVFFNEQWWWPAVGRANRLGVITGAYIDYYTEQTVPFFAAYDFLICNTHRHMSAFEWHPGAVYVPWGTNIQTFAPQTLGSNKKHELTFFHSAGISPHRKGTDLVLLAFKEIVGPAKLVIHVQRDLCAAMPEQSKLINSLRDKGVLTCHEVTVPAPGLFHLGDVYVYPTRLEGIGLTIMEAAACGLPVIVTDAAPMNEFIQHGRNGRLVAVQRQISRADGYLWPQAIADVRNLREQMQWYVDQLPEIGKLKKQARKVAESAFNWESSSASIRTAFQSTAKHSRLISDAVVKSMADYTVHQKNQYYISLTERVRRMLLIRFPTLAHMLKICRNETRKILRFNSN